MLWTILTILLVLWVIGFFAEIGGGLIHLLLLAAGIVFFVKLFSGRSRIA